MKNFYNYQTYYLGSPGKFEETTYIYLCNSRDLKVGGDNVLLNLSNLDVLREALSGKGTSDGILTSTREEDGTFIIPLAKGRNPGDKVPDSWSFDLIVYCDEPIRSGIDNPIRGYTLFSETQKASTRAGNMFNTLIVRVTMVRNEGKSEVIEVVIENSTEIISTESSRDYTPGDGKPGESWNYPQEIVEDCDSYIRYTDRILDFKRDPSLGIVTDCGLAYRGDGGELITSGLYIYPEIELDSGLYDEYAVGTFMGDLSFLKLNLDDDGIFRICSLSKVNIFGAPYEYRSGQIDLGVIEGWEYLYYAYSYLVFRKDGKYLVYFLEDETYLTSDDLVVIDSWDPEGAIRYIPESELKAEVISTCVTKGGNIGKEEKFYRKIGSWWIFKNGGSYYYYSPLGYIESPKELLQISDRLFMAGDIIFPIELCYSYQYSNEKGVYCYDEPYSLAYNIKDEEKRNILDCIYDGLRRKPWRVEFPEKILSTILGVIFYIEGDGDNQKLYCY